MALFVGEFDQTVDDKRRLAICAALREQMDPQEDGDGFFLVVGPDRHLWLYPDRYYRKLVSTTMKRTALPTREAQQLNLYFAMARLLKPDKQGRVVLPEKSVQRAAAEGEVTLVGINDHIEIWPRQEWEAHVQEHLPGYGEALLAAGKRLAEEGQGL